MRRLVGEITLGAALTWGTVVVVIGFALGRPIALVVLLGLSWVLLKEAPGADRTRKPASERVALVAVIFVAAAVAASIVSVVWNLISGHYVVSAVITQMGGVLAVGVLLAWSAGRRYTGDEPQDKV